MKEKFDYSSFFQKYWISAQLGSGVRNLYKYTKYYFGQKSIFQDGDVFRITVHWMNRIRLIMDKMDK